MVAPDFTRVGNDRVESNISHGGGQKRHACNSYGPQGRHREFGKWFEMGIDAMGGTRDTVRLGPSKVSRPIGGVKC